MAAPRKPPADFASSVFVNCPFDDKYVALMRPLLFTIIDLGFIPRISSESSDSGEIRVGKICSCIIESKYSIHDLSRLRASAMDEYYRMKMAFELGLDYATRLHGPSYCQSKQCLILEADRYEFHKALSDLSGVDIKAHGNKAPKVVNAVRDWFVETVKLTHVPSSGALWDRYAAGFDTEFRNRRISEGFKRNEIRKLPTLEYITAMREWVAANPQ